MDLVRRLVASATFGLIDEIKQTAETGQALSNTICVTKYLITSINSIVLRCPARDRRRQSLNWKVDNRLINAEYQISITGEICFR